MHATGKRRKRDGRRRVPEIDLRYCTLGSLQTGVNQCRDHKGGGEGMGCGQVWVETISNRGQTSIRGKKKIPVTTQPKGMWRFFGSGTLQPKGRKLQNLSGSPN